MRVAEIFGPTYQGEGPATGRRCGFVRLSGCDLACSWCDTPYTWDWTGKNGRAYVQADEMNRMGHDDVLAALGEMGVSMVVLTGGEPLVQRSACEALTADLTALGVDVWVETNGRHAPLPGATCVVSPKLDNAGNDTVDPIRLEVLGQHALAGSHLKCVCTTPADIDEVVAIAALTGFDPDRVWIMPEGRSPGAIGDGLRSLAQPALDAGFNLSGRLHVTVWGDERGR